MWHKTRYATARPTILVREGDGKLCCARESRLHGHQGQHQHQHQYQRQGLRHYLTPDDVGARVQREDISDNGLVFSLYLDLKSGKTKERGHQPINITCAVQGPTHKHAHKHAQGVPAEQRGNRMPRECERTMFAIWITGSICASGKIPACVLTQSKQINTHLFWSVAMLLHGACCNQGEHNCYDAVCLVFAKRKMSHARTFSASTFDIKTEHA